jgi:hypothetical protein
MKKKCKKAPRYNPFHGYCPTIIVYGLATCRLASVTWGDIRAGQPTGEEVEGVRNLWPKEYMRYPHLEKSRPVRPRVNRILRSG